ncbi:Type 4 fimbrial biogenesis protein PilW [Desulfurella amilsii]|uniref:Type 4 fimbrial biogenesis protein PilW n=1 Tax=Desulfurella amilsii TaxID=1562698 RepID=A0A1X4XZ21_9BACT|nr:prepilin-type N-terminal cleavage/methylation domain-containing protein [Desulfurella amilsii]OSS42787.1 Type 4 fimbrial biogenesis protein PilW [Desulfurella amilsii]
MKKGFTLIEILVALFITIIALSIGYFTYIKIMKGSLFQSSISSSQISTLSGTSLLQYDISMAGYGLPMGPAGTFNFTESSNSTASNYNHDTLPTGAYNIGQNSQTSPQSSYLVIRSAIADINSASQKFAVAYYNSNSDNWNIDYNMGSSASNFSPNDNDYCIVMDSNKTLLKNPNGGFYFNFSDLYNSINTLNLNQSQIYLIYGLNPTQAPRMPFNRVDYFLSQNGLPNYCDPDTYELYRSVVSQNNGANIAVPILGCVRAFFVETNINNTWYQSTSNLDPNTINTQTQLIKVFILKQTSKYSNSVITTNNIIVGDADVGTLFSFQPNSIDSHYEWKTIKMTIKPMNIGQNQ